MNKRGQQNPILAIISSLIAIIILIYFLSVLSSLSCSDEKAEIQKLINERNYWENQYYLLNESLSNCSNLIQEQIDICDSRINNSIEEYNYKNEICENYVIANKIFFIVYNILFLFIYIPLTFNLFKIVFKIGLKEKWEELISKIKKTLLIIKIIFWIILTVSLIAFIIAFLVYNPFNI